MKYRVEGRIFDERRWAEAFARSLAEEYDRHVTVETQTAWTVVNTFYPEEKIEGEAA